jgi:hypothetical protein
MSSADDSHTGSSFAQTWILAELDAKGFRIVRLLRKMILTAIRERGAVDPAPPDLPRVSPGQIVVPVP